MTTLPTFDLAALDAAMRARLAAALEHVAKLQEAARRGAFVAGIHEHQAEADGLQRWLSTVVAAQSRIAALEAGLAEALQFWEATHDGNQPMPDDYDRLRSLLPCTCGEDQRDPAVSLPHMRGCPKEYE